MVTRTSISGKVVVVTGASRGLGRAMAHGLAMAGATVAMTAREASAAVMAEDIRNLQEKCSGELMAVVGDINNENDCRSIVDSVVGRFGRIDVLINNAGVGMDQLGPHVSRIVPFFDIPLSIWRRIVETNVNGTFLMSKLVVPAMLGRGWGRIVNLSTSLSTMERPGFSPYGPSKAAIDVMTAIWSKELAETGVTVNALLPGGPCDTDMVVPEDFPNRPALIRPGVMVAPAIWLACADSDGITGMRISGKDWDPELPQREALERAASSISH